MRVIAEKNSSFEWREEKKIHGNVIKSYPKDKSQT